MGEQEGTILIEHVSARAEVARGPTSDVGIPHSANGWPIEPLALNMRCFAGRVENRRSNCSLPVVIQLGFRLVTSVRFDLVLFPVPAHRTGQADFPHPALGKDSRFRPRKVRGPVW
jgi:hypothetical protein